MKRNLLVSIHNIMVVILTCVLMFLHETMYARYVGYPAAIPRDSTCIAEVKLKTAFCS